MFAKYNSGMKRSAIRFCSVFFLLMMIFNSPLHAWAEGNQASELDRLLPLVGGALVEAGQGKWEKSAAHVEDAAARWEILAPKAADATKQSDEVDAALTGALQALAASENDPEAAKSALSTLAKAINQYVKSLDTEKSQLTGQEAAISLLPLAEDLLVRIKAGEWDHANADYRKMNNSWPQIESAVRADNFSVYGSLETRMSMIRISIQSEPPRAEQAEAETLSLIQLVNDYKDGKIAAGSKKSGLSIADEIAILDQALIATKSGNYGDAAGQMETFIVQWPAIEGEVRLRSTAVYKDIEIKMAEVTGYLLSKSVDAEKAEKLIAEMLVQLEPMNADTRYTAWDAGMVLLREGLEAILVLAALLAYLRRSGNADKQKWVWSGVWAGLLLSGVMAVILTYAIAQIAAGSARESIEGLAGLLSVLLMITVGNWLHSKSNMKNWNQYIDGQMGKALARGSLWSLFAVSCLAIFREGAETTIFYVGMAPSIDPLQLALGFGVTLVLLIALGFAIIKFSSKLPIRPFFMVASALIYYLVIRFLGESIHSLQVAGWVPSHTSSDLLTIGALGIYPTWETTLPQIMVLAYIICKVAWTQLRGRSAAVANAMNTE
ncbi:high-affinity iron transporter [Paenibacillus castaneae]|uniref:FTR1 family iron permease n=1 Tax=Paenibacillus castaneae TaxID=474957 RepID=UPI001FB984E4|nr:FTR1 family protein [Paenibacillus castaneae]NIK78625.1 high-affinity iron transporter [Paenibacillus castaneae]